MARTSTRKGRGDGARMGRGLKITLLVLLVLVVLVVLNAFALNNETEKARVTVTGAELVETTSGPLQVLDTGQSAATEDSSPLVLIHGSGGAINWWEDLIPRLSETNRVIAIDLLGYGGSAKPESGYSIDSQAGLVAQALNRLGVRRAVGVGHSLGGSVVTALAQGSPDLVSGIVLIDSSADRTSGGLDTTAKAALVPVLGQALWRISPDFTLRRGLSQAFAPDYEVDDKYVQDIRDMTYPAYRGSASAGDDFVEDSTLPDRIASTGLPLLVIFGEEDQMYPARESISAYAGVEGVETVLIPGSGHSPQVEKPEETAEAILYFTRGIDDAAATADAVEKARVRREAARKRKVAAARRTAAKKRNRPKNSKSAGNKNKSGKKNRKTGQNQP
ncbi:MAG: alpha/beta hydrolase [Actinomycetota bacterium]|nr:alpha/beta hydrolase [Actinomycetota bacterium]